MTNEMRDGDFERPELLIRNMRDAEGWSAYIHGASDAGVAIVDSEGRGGTRCARYRKTSNGNENVHLDQIVSVEHDTIYEVRAWTRASVGLNPVFAVMTLDWAPLATERSNAGADWRETRFIFNSFGSDRVRFEWFPGSDGALYRGVAGTSWLDDVSIRKLPDPSESLQRAFELARPHPAEEIDIPVAAASAGPVGRPAPLRAIVCRNGALYYEDGGEVALFGVNFQTALYWEYQARLSKCELALDAATLRGITDVNLDQVQRMNAGSIRIHLCPSDFTDADGNLRDSVFLDALDYTLAGCRKRGLYCYLTLVNEMKQFYFKDSFMADRDRREWIANAALAAKIEQYIRALLNRRNPYTDAVYKDDPTIAVIEIANEPAYVDYDAMMVDSRHRELRAAFDRWLAERDCGEFPKASYAAFRYEAVKDYVNRMRGVIRAAGCSKPVAWNLNWPRMIQGHEDVFQAVADSDVEVVSFCLYPGQSDLPQPYWMHPKDLGGTNYLPFLRDHYTDYRRLRWLLGKRFAGKAKAVYEFETFYNQTGYLYPAMAGLMRALGAQMAQMWTYSLSPAAERMSSSHHLNLECTPEKAVSFTIAERVFRDTKRYSRYPIEGDDNLAFGDCSVSFARRMSVCDSADTLMHTRPLDAGRSLAATFGLRRIVGIGSSPIVSYDGTGAYFVEIADDAIDIQLEPDSTFVIAPWQRQQATPWQTVCKLDWNARHRFMLRLPGWGGGVVIWRVEGSKRIPTVADGDAIGFEATPGRYRVERQR